MIKSCTKVFFQSLLIAVIVLLTIYHSSCQITTEGIKVISGDYETAVIESYRVLNENQLEVTFSKPVNVLSGLVTEKTTSSVVDDEENITYNQNNASVTANSIKTTTSVCPDGKSVIYTLEKPSSLGVSYNLYSEISDSSNNTLTFSLPFKGYNSNPPVIILSEIQDKISKPKCEYIELYCLTSGNLSGLEIYSANDDFTYEFESINVKSGEYITLHLRTYEETCVNELTEDLTLSSSKLSCPTARDLYVNSTEAKLGASADVIVLRNTNSDTILDAFIYSSSTYGSSWKKDKLSEWATKAVSAGIWQGTDLPESSFCNDGVTTTRSISRTNIFDIQQQNITGIIENSKEDWIITITSGASPGKENCYEAYKPE